MLSIDRIDTLSGFRSLKPIWNELLNKSESNNVFLTFEWLSSWWECFARENSLLILLVRDGEDTIAIAPLMKRKRLLLHVIEFIGTGRSDSLDFIIADGKNREALQSIFKYLMTKERMSIIHLRDLSECSPNIKLIEDIAGPPSSSFSKEICTISPYMPIAGTWDDYLSGKSGHFRQKTRRGIRKIESMEASFDCYRNQIDYPSILSIITEIERESWKQETGDPRFEGNEAQKFFEMVFRKFGEQVWFEAWLLHIGHRNIAYSVNFIYNNKLYYYLPGYALAERKLSPGSVLLTRILQDAFARGIEEIDFLRGDEKYKYDWTGLKRDLYQFGICNHPIPNIGHHLSDRIRWWMRKYSVFHTLHNSIAKYKRKIGKRGQIKS